MNKRGLLKTRSFARRKDENGHGGGGTPAAGENNNSGNSGETGGAAPTGENNSGQAFDFTQFWNSPASQDGNANPSGGESGGAGTASAPAELGQQLATQIQGAQLADLFDDNFAEAIQKGDWKSTNAAFQQAQRQTMTQQMSVVGTLLQAYGAHLEQKFQGMIDGKLGARDDSALLEREFASQWGNPAVRPQVKSVFEQSLIHAQGNKDKAVQMTREMLRIMGQSLGSPAQNGNNQRTDDSAGLLADLLGPQG